MNYYEAAAALAIVAAAAFLIHHFLKTRPTPEELERLRRALINARGKLGDGEIVDVEGAAIVYSYQVAGVGYEASQDVSALEALLPADLMSMVGPVAVKFDPRNPANSIVICEEWSGIHD